METEHRRLSLRPRLLIALALLVIVGGGVVAPYVRKSGWRPSWMERWEPAAAPPMTFDGSASSLARTEVVATLDDPIDSLKNVIWSSSFVSAWAELERAVGGTLEIEGEPAWSRRLDTAATQAPGAMQGFLAVAGKVGGGARLGEAERQLLAGQDPESLRAIDTLTTGALFAWVSQKVQVPFTRPYVDTRKPVLFEDAAGSATRITTFGVSDRDRDFLKQQARVLYYAFPRGLDGYPGGVPDKFAVDLDRWSEPNQIILAMIPPEPTLAATLATLDAKLAAGVPPGRLEDGRLEDNSQLRVPNLHFRVVTRFAELEGRKARPPGLPILAAQQTIEFRLDRFGAMVESNSRIFLAAAPLCFVFDRPFLIVIRRRADKAPLFVMWVANADLLQRWPEGDRTPAEVRAEAPVDMGFGTGNRVDQGELNEK